MKAISASQSEPPDTKTGPPLVESSSSEGLEEQDIQLNHGTNHSLLLQDTNYTKDTVASSQHPTRSEDEKGRHGEGGESGHVGFWHHELNNVRLHVLKLWARTGKMRRNRHLKLGC